VAAQLADGDVKSLAGRKALVTSGPTREALDPVRYISNFSSGKQGHAIAAALAALGAETTLVSGPTQEPDPTGVTTVRVESAMDMMAACEATLPVDIAVCAAAVSDWRASSQEDQKIKKTGDAPPSLRLTENPDVLASLARHPRHRPHLVIGFAAETENLIDNAAEKRLRKGCDWIIANDVSKSVGTFGASDNTIHLITDHGVAEWPRLSKVEVAERLGQTIAEFLAQQRPAA
jgi:phosphopantothenoylcysteine decarboxylase/phosphopantothenate--cysteine ligase